MNEEFLQYIWKHSLYKKENLFTTAGDRIEVINPGQHNRDAGPDFFNALIHIGDTLWAGNVEVHLKSSDWLVHNHHHDSAYSNVILHVVLENDREITLPNGQPLPAFIPVISEDIFKNYQGLVKERTWPACHSLIRFVDPVIRAFALDSVMVERIVEKSLSIEKMLNGNRNNWDETFYQALARNFGFKVNSLPFEMLARSLPLSIISKHRNNLFQVEALLFGQSGLLNEELIGDDYFLELRREYSFLAQKYSLKGMEGHVWKFLRMRPANFPTVRIAQFAVLLHQSDRLFSKITDEESVGSVKTVFDVKASAYWNSHYRFNQPSGNSPKTMGADSKNNLLINTVAPFLFLYGERNNIRHMKDSAIRLLESIPPESNGILTRWAELGMVASNAADAQALIQLKNAYCDFKKCLSCKIGSKVITLQNL